MAGRPTAILSGGLTFAVCGPVPGGPSCFCFRPIHVRVSASSDPAAHPAVVTSVTQLGELMQYELQSGEVVICARGLPRGIFARVRVCSGRCPRKPAFSSPPERQKELRCPFRSSTAFGQPHPAHRLPERASRLRADQDRQFRDRLPLRAGSDLRQFRVVRCRAGAARRGHLVEPAGNGRRTIWKTMLLGVAPPRRADDRRLGRRYRHQQPGRSVRRHHPGTSRASIALPRFRVGYFYSEVGQEALRRHEIGGGRARSPGSTGGPPLDFATLDATDRVVAVAGVHPYIKLLDAGRRRDHRRPQQRLRDLRRAGDPRGLSRGARLLSTARSWNAPRSAPSPMPARNRCSARSRWMTSR